MIDRLPEIMLLIVPGNEEGRNLARTTGQVIIVRTFDHRQAADARADVHPDALRVVLRRIEPGVAQGLDAGRHAEMDEGIHAARFLGRQVGRDVEILHLPGDLRLEGRRIELRDAGYPAAAGGQVVPGVRDVIADRRDKA
jgi:hypothetical protein